MTEPSAGGRSLLAALASENAVGEISSNDPRVIQATMNQAFWFAFLLTAIAGFATGIGSALAYLTRRTHRGFLAGIAGLFCRGS